MYQYKKKDVEKIVIRDFSFDFPDDTNAEWIPHQKVRSHFFNGVSLTMPHLEPFLVKTGKQASRVIKDEQLLEDIRGFCGQESQHYKCHRRLNDVLTQNNHPEFALIEKRMEASWKRLLGASLEKRLAYSAGFECMTNGFTRWMISRRCQLFKNADSNITSFWLMHMIEETEHKTVAFDMYMAVSGKFFPRFLGVFHGSCHVIGFGYLAMFAALKQDKVLHKPSTWWKILRETSAMIYHVGPFMLRALLPWHNPRGEKDPSWMLDWISGYEGLEADAATPLIDTRHPNMPVPFAQ